MQSINKFTKELLTSVKSALLSDLAVKGMFYPFLACCHQDTH
jgi:hypothetical protein